MYGYAANNPVRYTAPDGRNAYLVIWATKKGEFGHAAFAVDNYDEDGNPDGTVTFYELGPNVGISSADVLKNVKAYYKKEIYNKTDLSSCNSLSDYEITVADGIIQFSTDKKTDDGTKKELDKFMSSSDTYNAKSRNCSDMALVGVRNSKKGFKVRLGKERFLIFSFTTPNTLFNDSRHFKNASLLINPGTKTEYSFRDNVVVPEVKNYINNKGKGDN